jgi:hypothetical protein
MKKHQVGRNAATGKIVSVEEAKRLGDKAVVETVGGKKKGKKVKVGRDAGDGRFLGVDEAVKRGDDAIVQTIRR